MTAQRVTAQRVTAQRVTAQPARPSRRMTLRASGLAGIAYTVAWIISLSVGAPNPSVDATGSQVVTAFGSHPGPVLVQFALSEGVAAIALIVVVASLAGAARRRGRAGTGRVAIACAMAVAVISWAQLALGTWLFTALAPDLRTAAAQLAYHAITRADGVKMFLLAAMALAISAVAGSTRILPGWLAVLGVLLAAALVVSGLGYLFLAAGLASTVYVSGVLLLVFVTATGITLRGDEDSASVHADGTLR